MPPLLRRAAKRLGALLALGLCAMNISPALSATLCCSCHPSSNTASTICLTTQLTSSCSNIIEKSNNSTNLTGIVCDGTALDPNSSCQQSGTGGSGVCSQAPTDATSYTSSTTSTFQAIVPTLNVPIPGVSFTQNITAQEKTITLPFLGQYLAGVYNYLIGISVIAAAVMVVYGGFKYILGSSFASISSGKKTITDAIIGLILVFAVYTILHVVSPATTQLTSLTIPVVQPSIYTVPEGTFQTFQQQALALGYTADPDIAKALKGATGGAKPSTRMFPSNPFDPRTTLPFDQLNTVLDPIAAKFGIDPCILKAIVRTESGGRQNAIGHDEDASWSTSRKPFLSSGKTFSGTAFTPTTDLKAPVKNDDMLNNKAPDFGLDWRFAHGFGVSQCTIFPRGGQQSCSGPNGEAGLQLGSTCFTVPIVLTWEGNLECMSKLIQGKSTDTKDPCKIFGRYTGASSDTDCTTEVNQIKMDAYNSCAGIEEE